MRPQQPWGDAVRHFLAGDHIAGEWTVAPALKGEAGLAHGTAFAALHDVSTVWTVAFLAEQRGFMTRMVFLKPLRVGERVTTVGRLRTRTRRRAGFSRRS